MTFRTRFAPSPTGYLHLGHAFSALTASEIARAHDGEFWLRIEDIDHTRCRPEFESAIYEDLTWLGLSWPKPILRQSDYISDYMESLDSLKSLGVLYADAKTRKEQVEQAQSAPQEDIPPTATPMPAVTQADPAWRLSLDAARKQLGRRYDDLHFLEMTHLPGEHPALPEINGDVVLGRKDIGVAYHLAVVVDDARQGITDVVRGHDLFAATHTQVLLQVLLGLPTPRYHHHRLLLDDEGRRLAKRKGSRALRDYRTDGVSADDLKARLDGAPKQ